MPNKFSNKEVIRKRRDAAVKELALHEVHERTHTGTAVLRKLRADAEGDSKVVLGRTVGEDEMDRMVLHALLVAGEEKIELDQACLRAISHYGLDFTQLHNLKVAVRKHLRAAQMGLHVTMPGESE